MDNPSEKREKGWQRWANRATVLALLVAVIATLVEVVLQNQTPQDLRTVQTLVAIEQKRQSGVETAAAFQAQPSPKGNSENEIATQTSIAAEIAGMRATNEALVLQAAQLQATPNSTPNWRGAVAPGGCLDAAYVSDVTIPDGTTVKPNELFYKTWRLKNTGSCTWTRYFTMVFIEGQPMVWQAQEMPKDVAPGADVEISVLLTAPKTPGTYYDFWRLKNPEGYLFGDAYSTVINVR